MVEGEPDNSNGAKPHDPWSRGFFAICNVGSLKQADSFYGAKYEGLKRALVWSGAA
jgi:hypothetical protein